MELQKIFGLNVRNHRKALSLTQEELAERVDVTIETIGKIERGVAAPTFNTAEKIALALKINPVTLFGAEVGNLADDNRNRVLSDISQTLSSMNNDQLARISKMIEAFKGG
jgi:transcriptional regulator with XRE-family HTH domain